MLILSDRVTSWCHFAVAVFAPVAPASEKNWLTFQNHLKKKIGSRNARVGITAVSAAGHAAKKVKRQQPLYQISFSFLVIP